MEIGRRLAGESYAAIAAEGGGIRSTVRATREASTEELARLLRERLERMREHGTTTVEAKSGYGLTLEDEVRSLEVLAEAGRDPSLPRLVPTLLAAHEIPPEYERRRAEWVRIIEQEIVPETARRGLARFCDVFCDDGVFTVDESRTILEAARRAGMGLRIHADELARSGGAFLAAELAAASADHLLRIGTEEVAALARAGTVATILPGTAWWMRSKPAPARELVAAGVPVAVASDFNPGTCLTESLASVAAHACLDSGLSVEETLTAMTLNAAASLGLASETGSLEPGKAADVIWIDAPDDRHLIYHWGVNLVAGVDLPRPNRRGAMTDFSKLRLDEFLGTLASEAPTPGGGTAAAVAAAMGAALAEMVAALTLSKEKYAASHEAVRPIGAAAGAARPEFLALAREDAEAYDAVVAARRLPKETPEQKELRGRRIEEANRLRHRDPDADRRPGRPTPRDAPRTRREREPERRFRRRVGGAPARGLGGGRALERRDQSRRRLRPRFRRADAEGDRGPAERDAAAPRSGPGGGPPKVLRRSPPDRRFRGTSPRFPLLGWL